MVTRSYIVSNLSSLSRSFTNAKNQRDSLFFSKLAILELCGWIEESMDDVVTRCSARRLKLQANIEHCEKQIVKRTYGFDYQEHFRSMLIRLLGLINVEKIESRVDQQKLQRMTAALTTLKLQRNAEAHTHLKGTTRTINAPSVTITQFQPVYDGLREFERVIRSRNW